MAQDNLALGGVGIHRGVLMGNEREEREAREAYECGVKERMKRSVKIAEQVLEETGHAHACSTIDGLSIAISVLAVRIYDDINTPKS